MYGYEAFLLQVMYTLGQGVFLLFIGGAFLLLAYLFKSKS